MKKKLLILIITIVIIILTIVIKIAINDKKNKEIKKKYEVTNIKDNLSLDINISNGNYKVANVYDFSLNAIHTDVIQELSDKLITKEVFSKYSKKIIIPDKNLKYYGYAITKDGGEYIYTSIETTIDVVEHKIPLSKDDYKFIEQNFFNTNDVFYINIFPFKDEKHLFVEISYSTAYKHSTFAIVNLKTKTIKYLDDNSYYSPSINLRENIVILKNESDFLTIYKCIFDENGDLINKYY